MTPTGWRAITLPLSPKSLVFGYTIAATAHGRAASEVAKTKPASHRVCHVLSRRTGGTPDSSLASSHEREQQQHRSNEKRHAARGRQRWPSVMISDVMNVCDEPSRVNKRRLEVTKRSRRREPPLSQLLR